MAITGICFAAPIGHVGQRVVTAVDDAAEVVNEMLALPSLLPPPRTDGRVLSQKTATFNCLDAFLLIVSMVIHVLDVGSDIYSAVAYILDENYVSGCLTLVFFIVSSCNVMFFSLRWRQLSGKAVTKRHWIAHMMSLGLLHRYIFMFVTGWQARTDADKFKLLYQKQSDACILRMFESFLESAPQLVLQLHIMMTHKEYSGWTGFTAFTALSSMISLGWAVASYTKAMRKARPDKHKLSRVGLVIQTLWRVGTIGARVAALALMVTVSPEVFAIVMGLHFIITFIWVLLQKTSFTTTWWEEIIYKFIVAVVYCFCFFNLKEGNTRWRIFTYYIVTCIENLVFLIIFCHSSNYKTWIRYTGISTVIGGMLVGLIFMMIYYRFCHPVGPLDPTKIFWNGPEHDESQDVPEGKSNMQDVNISDIRSFKSSNQKVLLGSRVSSGDVEVNRTQNTQEPPVIGVESFEKEQHIL